MGRPVTRLPSVAWIALPVVLVGVSLGVRLVFGRRTRGARHSSASLLVTGEPDTTLQLTGAALRRLGAAITRYDVDAGTLEARLLPSGGAVRVQAAADGEQRTRLSLVADAVSARVIKRGLRRELARPES
jgi:hypothetical protein